MAWWRPDVGRMDFKGGYWITLRPAPLAGM